MVFFYHGSKCVREIVQAAYIWSQNWHLHYKNVSQSNVLWQKLRINIFLNGSAHEEWEPASAFHKNLSVFLELHLLYRTKNSVSNNRPVSYLRQVVEAWEIWIFPIYIWNPHADNTHTDSKKIWSQLNGHDFKSIFLFIYVAFSQWRVDIWIVRIAWVASWGPWHGMCNSDRNLFWWGFPLVLKISVFLGLSL